MRRHSSTAGKTFTLLEIVNEVRTARPDARIVMLAFNVEMSRQLRERLPDAGVDVSTIHALGLRMLSEDDDDGTPPSKRGRGPVVNPDKGYQTWRQVVGADRPNREWATIRAAVDRFRQDGEEPPWALATDDVCVVRRVIHTMVLNRGVVDQEDQVYHPVVYRKRLREPYDLVLVDERRCPSGRHHADRCMRVRI